MAHDESSSCILVQSPVIEYIVIKDNIHLEVLNFDN